MKMKMCKLALVLWLLFLSLAMSHFNVSKLNINGAREASKRSLLYELMNVKEIDAMFVQETLSDTRNESDWKREWGGRWCSATVTAPAGAGSSFLKKLCPSIL